MHPRSAASRGLAGADGTADGLELAGRLVSACPSPALLIDPSGLAQRTNRAAADLFGLEAEGRTSTISVRELLGVGWRELRVISQTQEADLVVDLRGADGRRRTARVRLEPVCDRDGQTVALVSFIEPKSRSRRSADQGPTLAAIFGHDEKLVAAKQAAVRFARTELPVLLLAETGSGKELLARSIYENSQRSTGPFVAINCGSLSPHLLESDLFGYAPGAFTGASREGREGKIGAARGGTLFLDEVAEMPAPLQALLLRVLEDGTYYRVGENRPRQADIRLICATCRDLPALVASGKFRQDLFYRINGACLSLPPVRQRTDVPELIEYLLDFLAGSTQRGPNGGEARPRLSEPAREWMLDWSWPGNVRELKTALQHALILCDGDIIRRDHLPVRPEGLLPPEPSSFQSGSPATVRDELHYGTLAEREAQRLVSAVDEAGGNLSRAARALGIARSTLYRRLRKHGLT